MSLETIYHNKLNTTANYMSKCNNHKHQYVVSPKMQNKHHLLYWIELVRTFTNLYLHGYRCLFRPYRSIFLSDIRTSKCHYHSCLILSMLILRPFNPLNGSQINSKQRIAIQESISSTFYAHIFCTKVCSKPNSEQRKAAQFAFIRKMCA